MPDILTSNNFTPGLLNAFVSPFTDQTPVTIYSSITVPQSKSSQCIGCAVTELKRLEVSEFLTQIGQIDKLAALRSPFNGPNKAPGRKPIVVAPPTLPIIPPVPSNRLVSVTFRIAVDMEFVGPHPFVGSVHLSKTFPVTVGQTTVSYSGLIGPDLTCNFSYDIPTDKFTSFLCVFVNVNGWTSKTTGGPFPKTSNVICPQYAPLFYDEASYYDLIYSPYGPGDEGVNLSYTDSGSFVMERNVVSNYLGS